MSYEQTIIQADKMGGTCLGHYFTDLAVHRSMGMCAPVILTDDPWTRESLDLVEYSKQTPPGNRSANHHNRVLALNKRSR